MAIAILIWAMLLWEAWKWYEKFHAPHNCGLYCEHTHWKEIDRKQREKQEAEDRRVWTQTAEERTGENQSEASQ